MKFSDNANITTLQEMIRPRMEALAAGKPARDIAADIYMTLPDKTRNIAYMMVDEAAEIIERYHADVDMSLKDEEEFIAARLAQATKDTTTAAERCRVYQRILVSLTAHAIAVDEGTEAAEQYVADNPAVDLAPEEAMEKEKELYDLAVEAIANSELVTSSLTGLLEMTQREEFDPLTGYAMFGRASVDMKLILAMQAYVNVQQNLYEDMPIDTNLEQVVYNVCGAVDTAAVAAGVENGEIDEPLAIRILRGIGIVLAGIALYGMNLALICLFSEIFSTFWFCLFSGMLIATLIVKGDKIADTALDVGSEMMAKAGYAVAKVSGWLVNGLKKLAGWAKPYVLKAIAWTVKTVGKAIQALKAGYTALRDAVRAVNTAQAEEQPAAPEEETEQATETAETEEEEAPSVSENE